MSGADVADVGTAGACAACAVYLGVDPVVAPVLAAGVAAVLRAVVLYLRNRKNAQ